jgi:hypothetical protein
MIPMLDTGKLHRSAVSSRVRSAALNGLPASCNRQAARPAVTAAIE